MVGAMPLWVHFPLSVAVAGGVAALSWRFVEKPALALKARAWHRPAPTGTAALRLAR
jgi:peptidoglycan/LPS O-acetylase OafA/YrhL